MAELSNNETEEPLLDSPLTRRRRDISDATTSTRYTTSGLLNSIFNRHVESVYLAEGLHTSLLNPEDLAELPRRFDAGSSKARLTWFGALCLTGIGMFVEAYIIITTGQIKTIWHAAYPTCFTPNEDMNCPNLIQCCGLFPNTPEDTCGQSWDDNHCAEDGTYDENFLCNESIVGAISYAEFAGIMLGMLSFGRIADLLGGHIAGLLTAIFSFIGVAMMIFYKNNDFETSILVFAIFFGVFGFGVGGEYPLTAASAASHHAEAQEAANDEERNRMRLLKEKERSARRGETISLVFAMQGVGAVIGSLFVTILLYFGEQNHVDCNEPGNNPQGQSVSTLSAIWRIFYFIGLIFVSMVLIYRGLIQDEGTGGRQKLLARQERRKARGHHGSTFKILKYYSARLLGTGGNWFLVDIAFYGLKLFSGPIMMEIDPSGNLVSQNGYLLINNLCGLAGYYFAAYVIDRPKIGRKRLQMASFLTCVVLFIITGSIFNTASPHLLLFLFFISSFVTNWMNVTSYVMAAETYPTELRATCHGISAFCGKTGALLATLTFGRLTSPQIFYVCGIVSGIGALFTLLFSVDLTHVSLAEHDAQLELFLEGRVRDYKGRLNNQRHLSLYEKLTKRHGEYEENWAMSFVRKDMERALTGGQENDTI